MTDEADFEQDTLSTAESVTEQGDEHDNASSASFVEDEVAENEEDTEVAQTNVSIMASALDSYRQLIQQLAVNRQTLHECRHELAEVRQRIRELSHAVKRDPRLEGDTDSHDLHTSKVAAQYDDCGSIIAYAEQVRRNVYENVEQAEELLTPMSHSVELLKLRVRHIRLLEALLAAQETGLRLEIQQRNADACIWQLADILKV